MLFALALAPGGDPHDRLGPHAEARAPQLCTPDGVESSAVRLIHGLGPALTGTAYRPPGGGTARGAAA